MKIATLYFSILILFSCKKEENTPVVKLKTQIELGKEIFEGKGNCIACHKVNQKVIGPSIQEIAKIYKAKNGNIINFLVNDEKPIVDPSQYEAMKINFAITKAMTQEELKAIETYIYSN